jgi:hypothetical protein
MKGLAFDPDVPKWPGGYDLELLWLLMGRSMEDRGAQHPHIERLPEIVHKIGNKPFRRNQSGGSVFQRDDHIETTVDSPNPSLLGQPAYRLFKSVLTGSEGLQGLFPGKKVKTLGLAGIYPAWQVTILYL